MKKYIYQVTAIVKANCTEYKYVVDVDADNQKEAVQTAKGMWDKVHHLFHIKARRLEAHEEALYGFWKQYDGEPQTKSKPEEAHVNIDEMTRATAPETEAAETETADENVTETVSEPEAETNATVKAAIARLTRRVKRETGDNIRDCFEAIAEGHDAASEAIAAMEKEADEYINAVTARFCADGTEVEPETAGENETNATETAPIQETRLDIAAFYEKYVEEYGFCKDSGDNVAGFDETVKAFSAFVESDANAAFVREFCAHMGDYITSDREAAAFMFALESMTAPSMCETEPQEPNATTEPVSDAEGATDSAEQEIVELHDDVDTYAVCEKNGIAWTRVNADTLAIRADDYQKLLDGAVNQRYIRNLRRDSNAGRFCGGAFSLAG